MPTDSNIITDAPNPRAAQVPHSAPKPKRISAAKQRKLVETAIERLIDLLDAIEPEPDLEPNLGSITSCGSYDSQDGWARGSNDDREKTGYATESDDEEPTMGWQNEGDQYCLYGGTSDGDNEPSLGWTDMEARYGRYADEGTDVEEQCEDEGAEHDGREPSLGWQNDGSQALLDTSHDDREEEHDGRENDYPRPPKGYMQPEDLGPANTLGCDLIGNRLQPRDRNGARR